MFLPRRQARKPVGRFEAFKFAIMDRLEIPRPVVPIEHDFRDGYWGHSIADVRVKGRGIFEIAGWGEDITEDDVLLLRVPAGVGRFKVASVRYYSDPRDMFVAVVKRCNEDRT